VINGPAESHIPELVDELDCHIFVDIVYTVAIFMYLYKYMFKGPATKE